MEETHQKVIEDIQRQHQREVSKLLEERERLLAEETAATIAGNTSEAAFSSSACRHFIGSGSGVSCVKC